MKAKTHNIKYYLFRWNFKSFELLFPKILYSLTNLYVLFKHKSLGFINLSWVCSCITFQYFSWNVFIFCSNFKDQPWMSSSFGAKLASISGIFLEKVSSVYKDSFPIPLLSNLYISKSISASILSKIAWKAPASSWSYSQLAIFLKIDPRCFGKVGKFQDAKEISM